MSDQTAPTYLEPIRDELDRLRTLLDDRSAALNRTGASNDTMRATLARIENRADTWDGYGHGLYNIHPSRSLPCSVCDLLAEIRAALAVPTDQETA